jgi:hypothetical protein
VRPLIRLKGDFHDLDFDCAFLFETNPFLFAGGGNAGSWHRGICAPVLRPTCRLEVREFVNGAVTFSPTLTATTSPLSDLPVVRLASSWTVAPAVGQNASFILWCSRPVDSWIVGMTAVREHHRIEGGI